MTQAAPGIVDHLPIQAAVHDDADALDGQRGLGYGCRKNDFALSGTARSNGPCLLFVGKKTVKGIDFRVADAAFQLLRAAADFTLAGQEGEEIAFVLPVRLENGFSGKVRHIERIGLFPGMNHLDGIHLPVAFQYRSAQ